MQIQIFDQALTRAENNEYLAWCRRRPWRWGESDYQGGPPAGVVSDLEDGEALTQLVERAQTLCERLQGLKLNRSYINMFMPGEIPRWHRDGAVWTVLYYVTDEREPQLGGQTEFLDYNTMEIRGVLPQPGRMIVFNGDLLHRATAYPHRERFTIALKFDRSQIQKGPPPKDGGE